MSEILLEMEMFDINRRDITSFEDFKKAHEDAGFAQELDKDRKPAKLQEYQRRIKRHSSFNHPTWDSTYKGLGIKGEVNKTKVKKNDVADKPVDIHDAVK